MKSRKSQSGFTLVEIAVVLVIIGLLLGAVLKGQELIENSRAKNAISEVAGIKSAHFGYIDRYRRTPGDDGPTATLTARGSNWAGVPQGNPQNGVINVTAAQTFNGGGENATFFRQLRAAGFITGDVTQAGALALPRNAFGGLTGLVNAAVLGYPQATLQICQGSVPGKAAIAIDSQSDDGNPARGSVRSTQGGNNAIPGAAAATYSEDQTYTVCTTM